MASVKGLASDLVEKYSNGCVYDTSRWLKLNPGSAPPSGMFPSGDLISALIVMLKDSFSHDMTPYNFKSQFQVLK